MVMIKNNETEELIAEVKTRKGVDKFLKGYCQMHKCKYEIEGDLQCIDENDNGVVYVKFIKE